MEDTQYIANTAMVTISTANSNLDGTGTLGTLITGASVAGTLIKTITIKAQGNTTNGMVRFFIYVAGYRLLSEVEIPTVTKSSADPAFELTIPVNYVLQNGITLYASTEKAETFNIIAEGVDWQYPGSVQPEYNKYTANTGMVTISTANSNLDGTGTLGTVLTATSSPTADGTLIKSVTIKSQGTVTRGMIRLFIYDGAINTKLLREITVSPVIQSGTATSFYKKIDFDGDGFMLKSGWVLKASTQNAETFNVIAEGLAFV